jgi:hypothetical protein
LCDVISVVTEFMVGPSEKGDVVYISVVPEFMVGPSGKGDVD